MRVTIAGIIIINNIFASSVLLPSKISVDIGKRKNELKNLCYRKNFEFINHQIINSHLWEEGVHLWNRGKTFLEKLDIEIFSIRPNQIHSSWSVDFNTSDKIGFSNPFSPMVSFYTSWKLQKTFGFREFSMFSRSMKRKHWEKMD